LHITVFGDSARFVRTGHVRQQLTASFEIFPGCHDQNL
jgi:hypothetical protein